MMEEARKLNYQSMADLSLADQVAAMMLELYTEDDSGVRPPDPLRTIRYLLTNPSHGRVILMWHQRELAGYAILIPSWSNEFGGIVVSIDELFVRPRFRGHGLARGLFKLLEGERPFNATAMLVEVSVGNQRARRLYQSNGFVARPSAMMARQFH